MLIFFPLIQNLIPLQRRADCIEHIAVGLAVNAFLECLDRQAQIDFIGRHILADIRQIGRLQGIQVDQKAQNLVISSPLGGKKIRIIGFIRIQIDFFRNPEVVHGIPVPVGNPWILQIIEVIDIGRIEVEKSAVPDIGISIGIE